MVAPAGPVSAFAAMVGVAYTLDVIRLNPSFEAGIGLLGVRGGANFDAGPKGSAIVAPSTAFGIQLGFAIDYLVNRHLSIGAVVRYHAFLTDITRIPVYLYVGPRVTARF
jgi:hypothetical protein